MRLADFKAVSFACYGTLIDRDYGVYAALRPLMTQGGVALTREQAAARFAEHEAVQLAETPALPYSDVLARVHRRLSKEWGVIASEDDHALFGQSVPNWPAFADVPPALRYLKRYYRLIVLSNADRHAISASMRRLEVMFDALFTPQDIGTVKPDRRNFDFLVSRVEKLGIPQDRLLHVAHSLPRDHVPAAACGVTSVWIDRWREGASPLPGPRPVQCAFRFPSLVDMVRAHQEELST
jgi:2-haloalkanoic acid dehalogenase type II